MLFNTIDFLIFFAVVIATVVIIKNRKFQHLFILFASYFFFYYSSNYLIILLVFTTLWDFYFGKLIWKEKQIRKKKIILIVSLVGNLGLLGFFKYYDFTAVQINGLLSNFGMGSHIPLLNLALPIGISFYTFHSLTYTVGIYRGLVTPVRLREYALFVAFFPQLVAGPILRANQFLPQLREKIDGFETKEKIKQIIISNENLKMGISVMALGFFKKMLFADNIAVLVNDVFNHPVGSDSFTIILGTIGFGIQIYCDFSGYTDIAIGAAMILGFKLPLNFNKPYFAVSPSDFWKRWHISLSSWLRDYLYIPLGGNQKSKGRTYLNLFIVMFLGGLWHGASWNFVIWGMLHGAYLAIHRIIQNNFPVVRTQFFKSKIGIVISILITQYFVFLAWIPFRVKDTSSMIYSMYKYVFLDFQFHNTVKFVTGHKLEVSLIIIFLILHLISYKKGNLPLMISKLGMVKWTIFLILIIIPIIFLYNGHPEDFVYFKF